MAMLILTLTGCAQHKGEKNKDYYGEIIAGLGDEVSYHRLKDGTEEAVSEEDYLKIYEEYQQSYVISFGYGASTRSPSGRQY